MCAVWLLVKRLRKMASALANAISNRTVTLIMINVVVAKRKVCFMIFILPFSSHKIEELKQDLR